VGGGYIRPKKWLKVQFLWRTWTYKEWCWKKKDLKTCVATTNYLEVMVDDEEIIQNQLGKICGNGHDLFSHTNVVKRWLLVDTTTKELEGVELLEDDLYVWKEMGVSVEATIRSKILTHFVEGKNIKPFQGIWNI
jgi:hypothetical protein